MTTEQPGTCGCRCHGGAVVSTRSPIEAAIACSLCRDRHAPALSDDWNKPLELPPKDQPFELDDGD